MQPYLERVRLPVETGARPISNPHPKISITPARSRASMLLSQCACALAGPGAFMRGLVQAWAKNSVVTGAVRYPLSPVVVQSPRCIACAVAHFRLAIAPSQVIVVPQIFPPRSKFPACFLCAWCARPSNYLCPFSPSAPVASRAASTFTLLRSRCCSDPRSFRQQSLIATATREHYVSTRFPTPSLSPCFQ